MFLKIYVEIFSTLGKLFKFLRRLPFMSSEYLRKLKNSIACIRDNTKRTINFLKDSIYLFGTFKTVHDEFECSLANPPGILAAFDSLTLKVDENETSDVSLRREGIDLEYLPLSKFLEERMLSFLPGLRLFIRFKTTLKTEYKKHKIFIEFRNKKCGINVVLSVLDEVF